MIFCSVCCYACGPALNCMIYQNHLTMTMKNFIFWVLVLLALISTVAVGMLIIGWAFNKPM